MITRAAAYVDPTARMFGDVALGAGASVWPYAVIRAESQRVSVGAYANVQDFVMVHVTLEMPTLIGEHCSVAHHATLHGCTLGDNVLVGIAATVADGAVVGENSIIAGNAFVREGAVIPPDSVVAGTPGKVVRERNCYVENRFNAWLYHVNALAYAGGNHRAWHGAAFEADARDAHARIEAEFTARYG
jgi:carbonic anhydrase/acetyltransferase-like protein (isoleucine patch superfamily)